jgi:hypothetical protein
MKQLVKIIKITTKWSFRVLSCLIIAYVIFWIIATYLYKEDEVKTYVGIFLLDLKRTDLGIYSDSIDMYRDLTIEFKKDKTFKFNKSVPFIADTIGTFKTAKSGRWNEIYYDNWKMKYKSGITGDQIGHVSIYDGDSAFYINSVTPRSDQIRKSNVSKVFFRKIGK